MAALTALLEADCKARHDTEVESKVLEQKAKEMAESTVRLEAERKARAELTAVLEADRRAQQKWFQKNAQQVAGLTTRLEAELKARAEFTAPRKADRKATSLEAECKTGDEAEADKKEVTALMEATKKAKSGKSHEGVNPPKYYKVLS